MMALNIEAAAVQVINWHGWCEQKGFSHTDQDQRHYIVRAFGDHGMDVCMKVSKRVKDLRAVAGIV